jgi:hypothetical protein
VSLAYYDRVDAVRFSRVGKSARWSDKEERRLRALYPSGSWQDLRAALPHRSKQAIEQHASKIGIERAGGKPAWTGAEIKTLRRLFEVATWAELCRALPRHTGSGIRGKGFILRLRRPPRTKLQSRYALIRELRALRRERRLTGLQLAEIIGCHKSRVQFWELGVSVPRFPMLIDWVEALGYDLVLRPREESR